MPFTPGAFISSHTRLGLTALVTTLLACGGRSSSHSPSPEHPPVPPRPLFSAPLAGQKISVLPLTLVVTDQELGAESPFIDRVGALHWGDSLLANALEARAPDVDWVLPAELRRIAHRAPSMQIDPDRMGQSIMGAPKLTFMPDPLRSYARNMVALAGGRLVLIPAAFAFTHTPEGQVKVEISVVLTDARNGLVTWRTLIQGTGATAPAALDRALRTMLPLPTEVQ